jgi:hypothetical protein
MENVGLVHSGVTTVVHTIVVASNAKHLFNEH